MCTWRSTTYKYRYVCTCCLDPSFAQWEYRVPGVKEYHQSTNQAATKRLIIIIQSTFTMTINNHPNPFTINHHQSSPSTIITTYIHLSIITPVPRAPPPCRWDPYAPRRCRCSRGPKSWANPCHLGGDMNIYR